MTNATRLAIVLAAGMIIGLLADYGWSQGLGSFPSAPAGKFFVYSSTTTTVYPTTATLTGLGGQWLVSVVGGTATFTLNGGSYIVLPAATTMSGDFRLAIATPTVVLTDLTKGATAMLYVDGLR